MISSRLARVSLIYLALGFVPILSLAQEGAPEPDSWEANLPPVAGDPAESVSPAALPLDTPPPTVDGPLISGDTAARTDSSAARRDSPAVDSAQALVPRRKLVSEARINTIDSLKGRYRSPRRALFLSLLVPGLGQAYVGHYARGAAYLLLEGGLIYSWDLYVNVKYDRQVRRYQNFADRNWSHAAYEDSINGFIARGGTDGVLQANPTRESFCGSVYPLNAEAYSTCIDLGDKGDRITDYRTWPHYRESRYDVRDASGNVNVDSVHGVRAGFISPRDFYEIIGKHQEYVTGWRDAREVAFVDTTIRGESVKILRGLSVMRGQYQSMRTQATDYSRMQAWFLGGIFLNHIVSAVDAALSARWHNKKLYQAELSWYDNLRLESLLASAGPWPEVGAQVSLDF